MSQDQSIREEVRDRYAGVARSVAESRGSSKGGGCCSGSSTTKDPISSELYSSSETSSLPDEAVQLSLGCGNPTALIDLQPGQTVLDLGSGGGIDVILSARRVGSTGKAYGVDMTDEMLDEARRNAREAGVDNVEFLKGTIEELPLPDTSVDVIISNCVINLSPDKQKVLGEAFRVLKPGGRFAVSDVVLNATLPPAVESSVAMWAGCVAGALREDDYKARLAKAGFVDVTVEPTRVYSTDDLSEMAKSGCCGVDGDKTVADALTSADQAIMSAFVRATKP